MPRRFRALVYLILFLGMRLAVSRADEIVPHAVQPTLQYGHDGTSSYYQSNGYGARASYAPSTLELFELNEFSWQGIAQDDPFSLNRIQGTYQRNEGSYHFEATGGLASSKFSVPEFNVLLEKTFGEYTTLGGSVGQSLFSELTQTEAGFAEMIRGPQYQIQGSTRIGERIRLSAFHRQFFFSDHNSRVVEDFAAFYGISTGWPWIWVGAGVENLLTHSQTDRYWSPLHFVTIGPRADISFPITEELTFSSGISLNRFSEVGGEAGIGYYTANKLSWKTGHVLLSGSVESILSEQNSNQWTANGFRLEATWLF